MSSKLIAYGPILLVIGVVAFPAAAQEGETDASTPAPAQPAAEEAEPAAEEPAAPTPTEVEPAETETTEAAPPAAPAPEPDLEEDEADAARRMDDLLQSRETAPVIEPIEKPRARPEPQTAAPASATIDIDPAVLGIAPGDDPPPLRREGEFIVNRRGRLIRSPESGHLLFVLESDASHAPELPLVMQACRLLEAMEDTVDRRGDTTVFILSGQVNTYRGANYLLPTMMKVAVDTGNLTN